MSERPTRFERSLLIELSNGDRPPAGLAMALGTVLATVPGLRDRGLLARDGFSSCRLTARGRAALDGATEARASPERPGP